MYGRGVLEYGYPKVHAAAQHRLRRASPARARPPRAARRLPRLAVGPVLLRGARGRLVGRERRSRRAHLARAAPVRARGLARRRCCSGAPAASLLARGRGRRARVLARLRRLPRALGLAPAPSARGPLLPARRARARRGRLARGAPPPARRSAAAAPHAAARARALVGSFNLFYPAFAAVTATAGCALAVRALRSRAPLRARALELARGAAPYALACAAVLPIVAFFQTARAEPVVLRDVRRADRRSPTSSPPRPTTCCASSSSCPRVARRARARVACRRAAVVAGAAGAARGLRSRCSRFAAIWIALIVRTPLFFSRYLVALSPLLACVDACSRSAAWSRCARRGPRAHRHGRSRGGRGRVRRRARCARAPELRGALRRAARALPRSARPRDPVPRRALSRSPPTS